MDWKTYILGLRADHAAAVAHRDDVHKRDNSADDDKYRSYLFDLSDANHERCRRFMLLHDAEQAYLAGEDLLLWKLGYTPITHNCWAQIEGEWDDAFEVFTPYENGQYSIMWEEPDFPITGPFTPPEFS